MARYDPERRQRKANRQYLVRLVVLGALLIGVEWALYW